MTLLYTDFSYFSTVFLLMIMIFSCFSPDFLHVDYVLHCPPTYSLYLIMFSFLLIMFSLVIPRFPPVSLCLIMLRHLWWRGSSCPLRSSSCLIMSLPDFLLFDHVLPWLILLSPVFLLILLFLLYPSCFLRGILMRIVTILRSV